MKLEYTQTVCVFKESGKCTVLTETNCVNCKFGKTKRQYNEDNDNAIKRCREKGLCRICKYRKHKCHLSTEKQRLGFSDRDAAFSGGMWGA